MTTIPSTRHPGAGDADLRVQSGEASPEIVYVPISQIRTGLKGLRSGEKAAPERPVCLRDLPLRAVKTPDGFYEVIDGFKRLEKWRANSIERRSPPSPYGLRRDFGPSILNFEDRKPRIKNRRSKISP